MSVHLLSPVLHEPDNPVPQADYAEKSVICGILKQTDGFKRAQDGLRADFFHDLRYRAIFEALAALAARGAPTDDILLLKAELHARKTFVEAGGDSTLHHLTDAAPKGINIPHYAGIVREKAQLRAIRDVTREIYTAASTEQDTAEAILARATRQINELMAVGPSTGALLSGEELSASVWTRVQEAVANGGSKRGLSTGFYDIDRATNGMRPGQLLIVAGRPGMGKTSLAGAMAWHAATHSKVVFFASVEMPADDLALRLSCLARRTIAHFQVCRPARCVHDLCERRRQNGA
jgi:replicative DNA helicase